MPQCGKWNQSCHSADREAQHTSESDLFLLLTLIIGYSCSLTASPFSPASAVPALRPAGPRPHYGDWSPCGVILRGSLLSRTLWEPWETRPAAAHSADFHSTNMPRDCSGDDANHFFLLGFCSPQHKNMENAPETGAAMTASSPQTHKSNLQCGEEGGAWVFSSPSISALMPDTMLSTAHQCWSTNPPPLCS